MRHPFTAKDPNRISFKQILHSVSQGFFVLFLLLCLVSLPRTFYLCAPEQVAPACDHASIIAAGMQQGEQAAGLCRPFCHAGLVSNVIPALPGRMARSFSPGTRSAICRATSPQAESSNLQKAGNMSPRTRTIIWHRAGQRNLVPELQRPQHVSQHEGPDLVGSRVAVMRAVLVPDVELPQRQRLVVHVEDGDAGRPDDGRRDGVVPARPP